MKRRKFLGLMGVGVAAPAIVRAESLMKIFVPPEKKIAVFGVAQFNSLTQFFTNWHEQVERDLLTKLRCGEWPTNNGGLPHIPDFILDRVLKPQQVKFALLDKNLPMIQCEGRMGRVYSEVLTP